MRIFFKSIITIFIIGFLVISLNDAVLSRTRGKLLYSKSDPSRDDTGPGSYRYPTKKIFDENPGIYDLREFRVYDEGKTYRFELEFQNQLIIRGDDLHDSANGFHLLMADIYIDQDHIFGSGNTRTITGRDVRFKPANAWDKMILISPLRDYIIEEAIEKKTEDLGLVNMKNQILIPHYHAVQGYILKVKVEKSRLGEYSPLWGFQVLIMGYDGEDRTPYTFFNSPVKAFSGPTNFGGSSNYFGAPNVIDIIVPEGLSQKEILSNFERHSNHSLAKLAYVPMCYSKRGEFLADVKMKMKLPGIEHKKNTDSILGDSKIAVEEDDFLRKLKAEGFIIPVDDLENKVISEEKVKTANNNAIKKIEKKKFNVVEKKLTVNSAVNTRGEILKKKNLSKKLKERELKSNIPVVSEREKPQIKDNLQIAKNAKKEFNKINNENQNKKSDDPMDAFDKDVMKYFKDTKQLTDNGIKIKSPVNR